MKSQRGDENMKQKSTYFDNYKIFGISTLAFYGASILLIILTSIFWELDGNIYYYIYDVLAYAMGIISWLAAIFSGIWFLITVIWCIVIAIKDKNPKVFLHPLVIINILLNICYPLGWIIYFIP